MADTSIIKSWRRPAEKRLVWLILLSVAVMMAGCRAKEEPEQRAISFTDDVQQTGGAQQSPRRIGSPAESRMSAAGVGAAHAPASEGLEKSSVTSFKVFAAKHMSDGNQTVMPNYQVSYQANTAGTTTSNTADWEYVGVVANQTIKYWDYSAEYYSFSAVAGTPAKDENGKYFNFVYQDNTTTYPNEGHVVNLSSENLAATNALYFTQPCKIMSSDYGKTVSLQFTPYWCKVRFGFYETMEGFSVQNLTFGDATNPTHLIATSTFVNAGTCSLTYDYAHNTMSTSITPTKDTGISTTKDFGVVQYDENDLLGTSSNNASFTNFVTMLPYEGNKTPITLTCSYEAVKDGIATKIKNIEVTVPASYAQWKPGMQYTYIFKITDSNIILDDVNQVEIRSWKDGTNTDYPLWNW